MQSAVSDGEPRGRAVAADVDELLPRLDRQEAGGGEAEAQNQNAAEIHVVIGATLETQPWDERQDLTADGAAATTARESRADPAGLEADEDAERRLWPGSQQLRVGERLRDRFHQEQGGQGGWGAARREEGVVLRGELRGGSAVRAHYPADEKERRRAHAAGQAEAAPGSHQVSWSYQV